jgi:hypothetical protein
VRRGIKFLAIGVLITAAAACAARPSLGRNRPDLAALISFDDGLFGFRKTYAAGRVGPFEIGDTRSTTAERIRSFQLGEDQQTEMQAGSPEWRLSLPTQRGGWAVYTLRFENERITSVTAYYHVFAGL